MAHSGAFIPFAGERLSDSEAAERVRAFRDVMARRRSVRHFSTQPVARELVLDAIRAAGSAPSGANQQPWTFVLISDPELKARIREAAEEEERINYAGRMSEEWRAALSHLGTDDVKEHITDAPFVIVVFEQVHGVAPDGSKVTHYYVKESVGIACGFLLAALQHAGLATLTHTPSPMGFLRDILGRPANERAFLLIPVGYPAENCQVPDITKKPLADILIER